MSIISKENRIFLRKFLQYPKQVGSLVPSSRFLAEGMVQGLPWSEIRAVAELGAGTGAITRSLTARVLPGSQVYLFEKNASMRRRLSEAYPEYVCSANAANLLSILERNGGQPLDCILSGLPFFNFSPALRSDLLTQIDRALKPGGLFIAFQYSLQMRKQLAQTFDLEQIKFVALNFPPAFVYVCRRRGR